MKNFHHKALSWAQYNLCDLSHTRSHEENVFWPKSCISAPPPQPPSLLGTLLTERWATAPQNPHALRKVQMTACPALRYRTSVLGTWRTSSGDAAFLRQTVPSPAPPAFLSGFSFTCCLVLLLCEPSAGGRAGHGRAGSRRP